MNSKNKRPRLELSLAPTNIDAGIVNNCVVNTTQLTSTNNDNTQSIFLGNATHSTTTNSSSNDSLSMLPANVFLTICDENSDDDEGQDYLTIGSTLAHIKQEHEDTLCIGGSNANTSSSTQSTQTLPVQYRVVNQMQRQLSNVENITSSCGNINTNSLTNSLNATMPMQLSNGCEIYIVKEYIDNMPTLLMESELLQGPPSPVARSTTTTIKLEPDSCITSTAATTTTASTVNGVQILRNTALPCVITTTKSKLPNAINGVHTSTNINNSTVTSISAGNGGEGQSNGAKRSCLLEAYKKRDDKRRATHNEVERRRRDKINNWIFKLKEMLPTEGSNNSNNNPSISNTSNQQNKLADHGTGKATASNISNSSSNNNNNGSNRTPPSDSKSQILIKACEYIRTMQDEIKCLRECLSENENLRLSNQRLQNELTKLQNERATAAAANVALHTRNFNSNFNITLNSLNSNNSNGSANGGGGGSASSSPGGTGSIFSSLNIIPNIGNTNTFTKRELIIRDYVD